MPRYVRLNAPRRADHVKRRSQLALAARGVGTCSGNSASPGVAKVSRTGTCPRRGLSEQQHLSLVDGMRRSQSSRVIDIFDECHELRRWSDLRLQIIRTGLRRYDGDITETARALGVGRSTLCRWVSADGLAHYVAWCRRAQIPPEMLEEPAGPT